MYVISSTEEDKIYETASLFFYVIEFQRLNR